MKARKLPHRTNYYDSWNKFRQSEEYKQVKAALQHAGLKPIYFNNLLRLVFNAGWGDQEIYFTSKK